MTTTQRMPWENRRLRLADQDKLAAAGVKLEDEKVASYVKNRNDYEGHNAGREQVDAYLNDEAISLYAAADSIADSVHRAGHAAMNATDHRRAGCTSHREGAEALIGLKGALSDLERRVTALRAALLVRAEDDDADAAMRQFVETYRAAQREA